MKKIIEELNKKVSEAIGCGIGVNHIHTDFEGWDYYIPAKSLQEYHPLVLNHYRGPLFMVIPYKDWERLKAGAVNVQEYIDNSVWSFGYFWGGGTLLRGIYWRPFEEKGIHNKEQIERYFSILGCRTCNRSSGHVPREEECMRCSVDRCPFSSYKNEGASWKNEVQEIDDRRLLFKEVERYIYNRFGFLCEARYNHDGESILLFAGDEKTKVEVYLPHKLLIDLLYNPGKYDIKEIANNLKIELGLPWYYNEKREFVPSQHIPVPKEADAKFCYDYWKQSRFFKW